MKYALIILLVWNTAQASSFSSWRALIESTVSPLDDLFEEDGPYLELPWKPSSDVAFDKVPPNPNELPEKPFSCADKNLWPTHPQQYAKSYLMALTAPFDRLRLPPHMSSCIIPNPTRRYCLRAQDANVMVMSDTFEDTCGNKYRGYWLVSFRTGGGPLRSEDNMGTMLSKGRTQYEKPHAQFPGETVTGYTYPVEEKSFIFFSKLLPGDNEIIKTSILEASRQGFTRKGLQFFPQENTL